MNIYAKATLLLVASSALTGLAMAKTAPFDLSITGNSVELHKTLELSDVGEGKTAINFEFADKGGKKYSFDLKYSKLASNRSYPTNLDITVKDSTGTKLAYLFFAINNVDFLQQLGSFGLLFDVDGKPMDVNFSFTKKEKGTLSIADLGEERFVQDTIVPKFGFQMIRPVIVPMAENGTRSVTYSLDHHPYSVNYTIKDIQNGVVQFQHNLYANPGATEHLLERIYFSADSITTLRSAMYAGKYFDKENGTFKLVFYPAMGQTEPVK